GRAGFKLRLRAVDRLRSRRSVWRGQRPIAAAADADVRPHNLDWRRRRPARPRPRPGRTRRQARPLVLLLPFQGRPGHAWLPRPRRLVADAGLLPRLAGGAWKGP